MRGGRNSKRKRQRAFEHEVKTSPVMYLMNEIALAIGLLSGTYKFCETHNRDECRREALSRLDCAFYGVQRFKDYNVVACNARRFDNSVDAVEAFYEENGMKVGWFRRWLFRPMLTMFADWMYANFDKNLITKVEVG